MIEKCFHGCWLVTGQILNRARKLWITNSRLDEIDYLPD